MWDRVWLKLGRDLKDFFSNALIMSSPKKLIINYFYARHHMHDKETLNNSSGGSFSHKSIEEEWNLINLITSKNEKWEIGNERGINF